MAGRTPNIIQNVEDFNLGGKLSIYSPSQFEADSGLKPALTYPPKQQDKMDETMGKEANPIKTPA